MTITATNAVTFEVRAIDPAALAELRLMDDAGHAPRSVTDAEGGSPLRCCLRLSEPGERIGLVSYAPLRRWARTTGADPGPYDEVGPVFIHLAECGGAPGSAFPAAFCGTRRMLRAYRTDGSILGGWLAEPGNVSDPETAAVLLDSIFADRDVALVHARAVEFGCFTFEVRRRSAG
jgi:hypothetical protein